MSYTGGWNERGNGIRYLSRLDHRRGRIRHLLRMGLPAEVHREDVMLQTFGEFIVILLFCAVMLACIDAALSGFRRRK